MPMSQTSPSGVPGVASAVVLERSLRPVRSVTARCLRSPQVASVDGGERLVQLPEARFGVRIAHVAQEHVVNALKILGLRGPAPVAPDDLAREALGAEDLVAKHLRVVARLRIHVEDQAAFGREQLPGRDDALDERTEVGVEALPAVVERLSERALDPGRDPAPLDQGVLAPGEKRRIEVDERRLFPAFGEGSERSEVVAPDQGHPVVAGAHAFELRSLGGLGLGAFYAAGPNQAHAGRLCGHRR